MTCITVRGNNSIAFYESVYIVLSVAAGSKGWQFSFIWLVSTLKLVLN